MKIKAEKDSSAHPSMQNDFLLYASKFIVQSHCTMRELPITTPIHIYYCFMTCLKLCAVLYLIAVCRRGLSHFFSIIWRKKQQNCWGEWSVGSHIILQTQTQFSVYCHPWTFFFNIDSLQASFSCWISAFCIIISADISDSLCQVESHFVISCPHF